MKNILSRNEYIEKMNEGFFKDTIKKGVEKVKSLFRLGMAKIKNFITVFDDKGDILPVISHEAVIDNFSRVNGVQIFATNAVRKSVENAGGEVNVSASYTNESADADADEELTEESQEFINLQSMHRILTEHYGPERAEEEFKNMVGESWEGVKKARVSLVDKKDLKNIDQIDVKDFEELLDDFIDGWCINEGSQEIDGEKIEADRNVLIFGAPGIGKSTVPNMVVDKFNKKVGNDPSKMISLISINCSLLKEGDFMMPTMPQPTDVIDAIERFGESFPESNALIQKLDNDQKKAMSAAIFSSGQYKASDAPKAWLPSFKDTGNTELNRMLNDYANGGTYEDKNSGKTYKTACGGIILFDEFLRAETSTFNDMMNFLLDRKLNEWILGSRWAIIACSNRPCDDGKVDKVWKEWNTQPAAKDRFATMLQLVPDPEGWKKWAREKKFDELLIKFIFEDVEDNLTPDGEYARWHSAVKGGSGESAQVKPITPRQWENVMKSFRSYELKHGYKDISEMSEKEIRKVLMGKFDTDFNEEIISWLEDHMHTVSLNDIIDNPKGTYLPKEFTGEDPARMLKLVGIVNEQFNDMFKKNPEKCSDDDLANIIMWFGINYPGDKQSVEENFFGNIEDIFGRGTDYSFDKKQKSIMMYEAAYPMRDMVEHIDDYVEAGVLPEGALEKIKGYMRENFPWRLEGDKILYYDDLDLDEKPEK